MFIDVQRIAKIMPTTIKQQLIAKSIVLCAIFECLDTLQAFIKSNAGKIKNSKLIDVDPIMLLTV